MKTGEPMEKDELRALIILSLKKQGFRVRDDRILPPAKLTKERVRSLHSAAASHRVSSAEGALRSKEPRLLGRLARGKDVDPARLWPKLVEVQPDSEDELLFRYVRLHWSIPVSAGYGRRLRFLILDEHTGKLMGLFGLGDPVFSLAARDQWVGWDKEGRRLRLQHVMDAFVLGAVPPYSMLLCGKLAALLVTSDEVRNAFLSKYGQRRSVISQRPFDGRLALITTSSALGRSSLYNRVKYNGRLVYVPVGLTQGSGEFHFSDGLYHAISTFVSANCEPTAKQHLWGSGFRNRREIIRKCLAAVDLPADWICHGIRREVFAVPLAQNTRAFLCGQDADLSYFHQSIEELSAWFRKRWLLPRAERDHRYKEFVPESYALWTCKG